MKETMNTTEKETINAAGNTAGSNDFKRSSKDDAVKRNCESHKLPDEAYRLTGEGLAIIGTMLNTAMQQLSDAVDVVSTVYDLMNTCSEAAERDRLPAGDKDCTKSENKSKNESDDHDFFFGHLTNGIKGPFTTMEMVVGTDLEASIMDELSMLQTCEWFSIDDEVVEIPDLDDVFLAYAREDEIVRGDGMILVTGPVVVFKLDDDDETVTPTLEDFTKAFMYLGSIAVTEKAKDGKKFRAFLLS